MKHQASLSTRGFSVVDVTVKTLQAEYKEALERMEEDE